MSTTPYAVKADLQAYVGTAYTLPSDAEITRMILRASELIYEASGNLSELAYDGRIRGYIDIAGWGPAYITLAQVDYQTGLKLATCAQVEFWLEFGEESDVLGLNGAAQVGRFQLTNLPDRLAPRARRYLRAMGLAGVQAGIR